MKRDLGTWARREARVWGWAILLMLLYVGWDRYWAPERWYELNRVFVSDAVEGGPLAMAVDRRINREFDGSYVVTVRRLPKFQPVCSGGSSVAYEPTSTLPAHFDLNWWAYGAIPSCATVLTPGKYEMQTCITINPNTYLLGPRRVCRKSNIFTVLAKGDE